MTWQQGLYQAIRMFGWPRLDRVCVAAITWQGDGNDESTWDMTPYAGGQHFTGEAVARLLRENDYRVLISQHWMPGPMVARMRELVPGLKILMWCAVEAIQANPFRAQPLEWFALYTELSRRLLMGTDGQVINFYYGQQHEAAWAVDMLSPGLADAVVPLLVAGRRAHGYDGYFLDSVYDNVWFGTAPNAPPRYNRHAEWLQVTGGLRKADPGAALWANTVGRCEPSYYGIDVAFAERYFVDWRDIGQAVDGLCQGLCVNTNGSDWATAPRRWKYLAHAMMAQGLGQLYVCTAWTGQQLFEPEWRWP